MLIPNRTKTTVDQRLLASMTLPWTQEKFTRSPYSQGLGSMGDDTSIADTVSADVNSAINQAINTGMQALTSSVTSSTSADPVPVQNAVLYNVLAPVSNALGMAGVVGDATVLNALLNFLNNGINAWNAWTQAHPSSRTTGAQQTLQPYFTRLTTAIQTDLMRLGASPSVIPGTNIPIPQSYFTSGISAGMVAVAAIALYWFSKK